MLNHSEIKEWLSREANRSGLVLLGVAALGPEGEVARFKAWVDAGLHAGMKYLERQHELRADPRSLLAGARSAVVVALPYGLGDRMVGRRADGAAPRIAQYARFAD